MFTRVILISLAFQTAAASGIVRKQNFERSKSAELLAQVERMLEGETSPPSTQVSTIKQLVDNDILPALMDEHKAATTSIENHLAHIKKCNADSTADQNKIKSGVESTTDSARQTHATCREEEKEKESTKNGACQKLDTFLDSTNTPATRPEGRDAMVKYVEDLSSYFCPKGPVATDLDDACKKAEKEHKEHQEQCNKKQYNFETDFCVWRAELIDECKNLETCYETAKMNWQSYVDEVQELVKKWKVEYKTIKKISCYVNIWLEADATEAKQDVYSKCKSSDADDSVMNVAAGEPEAQRTCDTTPVEIHPGESRFPNQEYSKFSEYAVEPLSCPA